MENAIILFSKSCFTHQFYGYGYQHFRLYNESAFKTSVNFFFCGFHNSDILNNFINNKKQKSEHKTRLFYSMTVTQPSGASISPKYMPIKVSYNFRVTGPT